MRRLLVVICLLALVVVTAAEAATPDPARLVLRRGDLRGLGWVPSANNGYRTADQAAQGAPPGTAARFANAGFVRGYDASWGARAAVVGSTAYVFKTPTGARRALQVYRESAPPGTRRIAFKGVGNASLAFRSLQAPTFTAIVWRNGRVLSIVLTGGMADNAIRELVRIQGARVAAAG
jgi:hypothetical protein